MSTNRWVEARVRDPAYVEVGGGREGNTSNLRRRKLTG